MNELYPLIRPCSGLFDAAEVERLYQAFLQGEGPYMRVWCLAVLELWLRRFLP